MKRLFLISTVLLISLPLWAGYDVVIDGIYYKINAEEKTAVVTNEEGGKPYDLSSFSAQYKGSIVIPETIEFKGTTLKVTSIGDYAFYNCKQLTVVALPDYLLSIGQDAFYGCKGLTAITIPEGVTKIGDSAFEYCSGLTAIIIPEGVTSIENYAFSGCSGLTSITIPEGVTSIGQYAFSGCWGLTSITIPSSVTSIGRYAFQACWGELIINCDIPSSSKDYPPFNNSSFKSVKINGKCIGDYAFYQLSSIQSIELGENVTSIGNNAFSNCTRLSSIIIPSSVTNIGKNAFSGCSSLPVINNIRYADTYLIEAVDKNRATYSIKEDTRIIGFSAFFGCPNMASVTIPSSVTTIYENAFSSCPKLTSVSIPEHITNIDDSAFSDCSGLILVTISCPNVGSWFCNHTSIKELILKNGVTAIEPNAFSGCTGLTSLSIPSSVTTIGKEAFMGCSGLTSVAIPESVNRIGVRAFQNCSSLPSIFIPKTVTEIADQAFYGCNKIEKVVIDGTVTSCGHSLFSGKSLKYVELKGDMPSAPFAEMTGIEEAVIGGNATYIFDGFFSGCSSLKKVTLGENIRTININSFKGNVKLDTLTCLAVDVPYCLPLAFDGNNKKCTLVVPDESHSKYSVAEQWKDFRIILGGWHTLTYRVDEKLYKKEEIRAGETIEKETQPEKEGYTFSGWENLPETMPAEDVTVTGSFTINSYTMKYVLDGEEYTSYEVTYGTDITPEAEPTKEGCTFSGWNEIPETMPAEDVTVTGSFTINSYTLTYILDGEEYKTFTLEYGSEVTAENVPEREGYTFSGWENLPKTMPAEDVTVTGSFSINSYTLTYILDGEEYKTFTLEYGSEVTTETSPEKEGYTFSGWSEMPETMPAEDVTVTGSFTINQYTVTFIIEGKVFTSVTLNYGAAIILPTVPEKEGYEFSWGDIPEKMPAEDMTVFGSYTSKKEDCLLAVKGITGGAISLMCQTFTSYSFLINPETGWKVSSVSFNGEDVTSQAMSGTYTTPSLTGDSELSIVFEQDGSAVKEVKAGGGLRVRASGSVLYIDNEGSAVQAGIYTTDGKQVKRVEAANGTTSVSLQTGNVYLIKVGERTFKVAM